jgi:hypothetical protein
LQDLQAVDIRKADVEDDEMEGILGASGFDLGQGLQPRLAFLNLVPMLGKADLQLTANRGFVVHH